LKHYAERLSAERNQEIRFETTLTGFKYLANRSLALERDEGYRVVLAYEEALGYMISTNVLDKDGISALVVLAELCHSMAVPSVTDYLNAIYHRCGLYGGG
jgi:phosphomannomutase